MVHDQHPPESKGISIFEMKEGVIYRAWDDYNHKFTKRGFLKKDGILMNSSKGDINNAHTFSGCDFAPLNSRLYTLEEINEIETEWAKASANPVSIIDFKDGTIYKDATESSKNRFYRIGDETFQTKEDNLEKLVDGKSERFGLIKVEWVIRLNEATPYHLAKNFISVGEFL